MKFSCVSDNGILHYTTETKEEKDKIKTILIERGAKVYGETKMFCFLGYNGKDIDILVFEKR